MPYLRDTRRSIGISNFTLQINHISGRFPQFTEGTKFHDRVALASYNTDIHYLLTCQYPEEMKGDLNSKYPPLPFYIPFRSLTNKKYKNLLVSGKTIAQSFLANSNTRLHPVEWNIGTASGVISAYMVQLGVYDTEQIYE